MSSPIDDIKARIDIAELVQSYVRLQKAGVNFKTTCPFHAEKTPSFFVTPSRQIWHCFGCGKGGDIFKFVMEIEGYDFPEALRMLASRAGVTLKREDPRVRSERNLLYDINEDAAEIFEESMRRTPAVHAYLKSRGITGETARDFRIGFAPASWDFLLRKLSQKYKPQDIELAGLILQSQEKSSYYDRFRSRIMFPIADANGRIIGFGGRIFAVPSEVLTKEGTYTKSAPAKAATDTAKYINTPQTPIYDKSRVLYGFDKSKQDIRSKNQAVLVEGYMDCILSHQAGLANTIAVSGTALTPQQLKTLRRLCDTIVTSFDTDAAGESATRRSLALASQFEFERRIALIPSGKDPADAVQEDPQSWLRAVEHAEPVVDFYFAKAFRERNPDNAAEKKQIAALLLPLVAELTNEIERAHWMGELAKRLRIPEDAIWKELKRATPERSSAPLGGPPATDQPRLPDRRDLLEERFLALLPSIKQEVRERELATHHIIFVSALNQELFTALRANTAEADLAPAAREALTMLRFKGELLAQIIENTEDEFLSCKRELEKECVKEQLLRLGAEIDQKEKAGNHAEVAVLLQNFRELSTLLKTIAA